MKIRKFFIFSFILIFSALTFIGCSLFQKPPEDLSPEVVLPQDSFVVISIDYSNIDQITKFEDLLSRFPETGLWQKAVDEYNDSVKEELSYEELIKPILDGNWKILIGIKLAENDDKKRRSLLTLDDIDVDSDEVYIVGKFSETDKVKSLIDEVISDNPEVEIKREKYVTYYTLVEDDQYAAFYGDIFFITNNEKNRAAAISRLSNGEGFELSGQFISSMKETGKGNLGYIYVDGEQLASALEFISASSIGIVGDLYVVFKAEEDGFRMISKSIIDPENEQFSDLFPNMDYKLELIDKVPAEGVILYMEEASLSPYIGAFWTGFSAGFGMMDTGVDEYDLINQDAYEMLLEDVADFADITVDDVRGLFKSPFAFSISDVGELVPSIAFYVRVDDKSEDAAKSLSMAIDEYFSEVLEEFNKTVLEQEPELEGFIKKERVIVRGGGLHKVYIDWSVISEEKLDEINTVPGFDLTEIDAEIYYGLTGDNVFVVALYPGFDKAYVEDVLSDDELFNDAMKDLGDNFGFGIRYLRVSSIMDLVDRYVEIAKDAGGVRSGELEIYYKVRGFISTIESVVRSVIIKDNLMISDSFIRIKEGDGDEVKGGNTKEY